MTPPVAPSNMSNVASGNGNEKKHKKPKFNLSSKKTKKESVEPSNFCGESTKTKKAKRKKNF